MRKIALGLLIWFLVCTVGFSFWLTNFHMPHQFEVRWREHYLPRVELIIKDLEDQGSDETVAHFLCERPNMTIDAAEVCMQRIEFDNNTLHYK